MLLPRALLELVWASARWAVGASRVWKPWRLAASLGEGVVGRGGAFARYAVRAHGAGTLPPVPVLVGLQAELRPYQQHGFMWLQFLRAPTTWGKQLGRHGAGKTLQTPGLPAATRKTGAWCCRASSLPWSACWATGAAKRAALGCAPVVARR